MKKSNVIITVVLAAVSIFLLALWYMLGFNEIDSPLDLVISVVWWAVIVAGIAVAAKTESTRRQRIRTVYVADGAFYNSEAGNRGDRRHAGQPAVRVRQGRRPHQAGQQPARRLPLRGAQHQVRPERIRRLRPAVRRPGRRHLAGRGRDGGHRRRPPLQQQARACRHHRLARTKRPAAVRTAGRLTRSTSSLRLDGGAGAGPTPTHLSSRDSSIPARVVYVRRLRPRRHERWQ